MFTARGYCWLKDGKIHTDTESKIITALLYMNRAWAPAGGRLRLLRSAVERASRRVLHPEPGTQPDE